MVSFASDPLLYGILRLPLSAAHSRIARILSVDQSVASAVVGFATVFPVGGVGCLNPFFFRSTATGLLSRCHVS